MRWAHAYQVLAVAEEAEQLAPDRPRDRGARPARRGARRHPRGARVVDGAGRRHVRAAAVRGARRVLADAGPPHRGPPAAGGRAVDGGGPAARRPAQGAQRRRAARLVPGRLPARRGVPARGAGDRARARATRRPRRSSSTGWAPTRMAAGDLDAAEAFASESLAMRRRIGDPIRHRARAQRARRRAPLPRRPRHAPARCSSRASRSRRRSQRQRERDRASSLTNLGLRRARRRPARGRRGGVPARRSRSGSGRATSSGSSVGVHNAALLALDQGRLDEAATMLTRAHDIARDIGDRMEMAYAMADLVRVDVERGDLDGATDGARGLAAAGAHDDGADHRAARARGCGGARRRARRRRAGASGCGRRPRRTGQVSGFANMPADQRLLDAPDGRGPRAAAQPRTVDAAWAEGRAMSVDAAIEAGDDARRRPRRRRRPSPADATNRGRCNRRASSALSGASTPNGGWSRCADHAWSRSSAARCSPRSCCPRSHSPARPRASTAATVTPTAPNITLRCARVIPAGHPARDRVVCHWTAVTGVAVRAYRAVRFVDAPPRPAAPARRPRHPGQAAARRRLEHRRRPPYSYRVVAIGTDGSRVGHSNLVSLRVGRRPRSSR